MLDTFRGLVRKERPDYIIEIREAKCGHICAVTCKYARGGRYFAATSFYTDTWISSNPLGPIAGVVSEVSRLNDVSDVREFSSADECVRFSGISDYKLEKVIEYVRDKSIGNLTSDLIAYRGDHVCCKLLLAPFPVITVVVKSADDSLIGTLTVTMNGTVTPVIVCSDILYEYANLIGDTFSVAGQLPAGDNNCVTYVEPMSMEESSKYG